MLLRAGLAMLLVIAAPVGMANSGAALLEFREVGPQALERQPLLHRQAELAAAAAQRAVAAGQLPDPQLSVGLKDLPIEGREAFSLTRDSFTEVRVGISQSFPRTRKRRLLEQGGRLEAQKAEQELEASRREVVRDAELAWLDAFRAERSRQLAEQLIRESILQRQALTIAHRTGRGTQAEVLAADVEVGLMQDRLLEFDGALRRARAALARWIGAAAERPLPADLPTLPEPQPLAEILAYIEHHPHLDRLRKVIEMSQNDVELARQGYRPDWGVEVYYGYRASFADFVGVQVSLDLPYFTKNRQDRRLNAQLHQRAAAEDQREDLLRSVGSEASEAHADWRTAKARLRSYEQDILAAAQRRLQAAEASYGAGHGELSAVLAARRALLDLRLQRLALEVQVAAATVRLAYFVGEPR